MMVGRAYVLFAKEENLVLDQGLFEAGELFGFERAAKLDAFDLGAQRVLGWKQFHGAYV